MIKMLKIKDAAKLPYLDHFAKECIKAGIPVDCIVEMLKVITHQKHHKHLYTMVWEYVGSMVPQDQKYKFATDDFNYRRYLEWYAVRQTTGAWPSPLKEIQDAFGASRLYDYGIDWHIDRMFRGALEKKLSLEYVKKRLSKAFVYILKLVRVRLPKETQPKLQGFLEIIYPDAFLAPSETTVTQNALKAFWKQITEECAKEKPVLPHSSEFDITKSKFYVWRIEKLMFEQMADYTYLSWSLETVHKAQHELQELFKTSITHPDYRYISVAYFRYLGYEGKKTIAELGDIHNSNPRTVSGWLPKGYRIAREKIQHLVTRTVPDKKARWNSIRTALVS